MLSHATRRRALVGRTTFSRWSLFVRSAPQFSSVSSSGVKYQDAVEQHLVDPDITAKILKPYWTQFVGESHISHEEGQPILRSKLGVSKPWYCNDTGHMNAVELNLAFNQMMYVAIYQSIRLKLIPELAQFDLEYFMSKYWPDFLITKVRSEFKLPILVNDFRGTLRIKKVTPSSKHLWFELDLAAKPAEEGFPEPGEITHAGSEMTLAIKDYKTPRP